MAISHERLEALVAERDAANTTLRLLTNKPLVCLTREEFFAGLAAAQARGEEQAYVEETCKRVEAERSHILNLLHDTRERHGADDEEMDDESESVVAAPVRRRPQRQAANNALALIKQRLVQGVVPVQQEVGVVERVRDPDRCQFVNKEGTQCVMPFDLDVLVGDKKRYCRGHWNMKLKKLRADVVDAKRAKVAMAKERRIAFQQERESDEERDALTDDMRAEILARYL